MTTAPTYRIIYADGIISTPLPWERILYDVGVIGSWGIRHLRPVRVIPGDASIDMAELHAFLRDLRLAEPATPTKR